jgi:hypothetical protein
MFHFNDTIVSGSDMSHVNVSVLINATLEQNMKEPDSSV